MLRPDTTAAGSRADTHTPTNTRTRTPTRTRTRELLLIPKRPSSTEALAGNAKPARGTRTRGLVFPGDGPELLRAEGALAGAREDRTRRIGHSRGAQGPVDLLDDPQRGVDLGVHGGHHAHHDDEPTGGTGRVHAGDDAVLKRQAPGAAPGAASGPGGCLQQGPRCRPDNLPQSLQLQLQGPQPPFLDF